MTIEFASYPKEPGFTEAFLEVSDFLKRINQRTITTLNFEWARWEWMFSLPYLKEEYLDRIGLWRDNGRLVALATYETDVEEAFICVDPQYHHLKPEAIGYVQRNFSPSHKIFIDDHDRPLQRAARQRGYRATEDRQSTARFEIIGDVSYTLPEGFSVITLAECPDIAAYSRVLWRGFDHQGEPPLTEEHLRNVERNFRGPHVNLHHKVAVVAPNGEFAAFCGMWYQPDTEYALVEPVATDPHYRRLGLGRAAVLEGIRRCAADGAKEAYVGSSQQFYYNIGFAPDSTASAWRPTS